MIAGALGNLALRIEHVGSTAVPGLLGKPVLDVAVAVRSEVDADTGVAPLVAAGYTYRGRHGEDPRRRYYVRDRFGQRAAQIHLYILPAQGWEEQLVFRDALRTGPDLASAYATEKLRIAEAVAWNKLDYSIAKGQFIEDMLLTLRAHRVVVE
jgi:GrpB-like predicted nucleotidyltransferase (UPF0157 family)